jgi:hypothetical protein
MDNQVAGFAAAGCTWMASDLRRWKLYGEEALARHPAVIWLQV